MNDSELEKLAKILNRLDAWLRSRDLFNNAIYPPFLKKPASTFESWRSKVLSWFRPRGHAATAGIILVAFLVFLIFGPALGHANAGYLLLAGALVAAWVLIHHCSPRWVMPAILGLVAVVGLAEWLLSGGALERDTSLYRHILVPISWVLIGNILIAYYLAYKLFKRFEGKFADKLRCCELLVVPPEYPVTLKRYFRSLFTAPFYHTLYLLLPSSLLVLALPEREIMIWVALGVLLISLLLLAAAGVHERLTMMLVLVRKMFFTGGQLIVSLVVIALAAMRLGNVHYVSFLIESHPQHVNYTILSYVLTAYLSFWFYEYWINRVLSERLLTIMRDNQSGDDPGCVRYEVSRASYTKPNDNGKRQLRIHGASRFVAMRTSADEDQQQFAFETYRREKLFDAIGAQICPSERELNQVNNPTEREDIKRWKWSIADDISVIKQRYQFFFLLVNIFLFSALAIPGYYFYAELPQKAELTVSAEASAGGFNLRKVLKIDPKSVGQQGQSAVLLAASGGGTRAALYTQSLLQGLARLKRLDDLILVSGVSGGGAALAYFAAHKNQLIASPGEEFPESNWKRFSCTMASPFIQDVLEGVVEWRVLAGVKVDGLQQGLRLGELLAESFNYRYYHKSCDGVGPTANLSATEKMGQVENLGIILNTALTGHFPGLPPSERREQPSAECINAPDRAITNPVLCEWPLQSSDAMSLAVQESSNMELQTSLSAGGRLILTNLADTRGFPSQGMKQAPSEYLTYVALRDPEIRLTIAAALNANFPPVFSNAAVDVFNNRRYWVTDGGATDNRGIISLLYALKHAVTSNGVIPRSELRDVDIIIAEASATSLAYTQDRGTGGIFGAAQKFASQLMLELKQDLENIYGDKIRFHYLSMPMVLRSGGGVGTHWMLPANVTFKRPLAQSNMGGDEAASKEVTLSGDQVRSIIDALHAVPPIGNTGLADSKEQLVWDWITADWFTNHPTTWEQVVTKLGHTP